MSVNEILFAGSQWFKAGKLPKQVTAKANWTILLKPLLSLSRMEVA